MKSLHRKVSLLATLALGTALGMPQPLLAAITNVFHGNYISHVDNNDTGLPGYNLFSAAFNSPTAFSTNVRNQTPSQQDVRGNRDPVIMFKLGEGQSIDLSSVLIGVNNNISAGFDLTLRIYSQSDVTTPSWAAGSLLREEVFPVPTTSFAGPARSTLELVLTTPLLLNPTSGSAGYAIQFDVEGETTTMFSWAQGSFPITQFEQFRYYRKDQGGAGNYGYFENAWQSIALVPVPEPASVVALAGLAAFVCVLIRRRLIS